MDDSTLDNRKCFFCKGKGHMKNACSKFAEWKKKKGFQKEKSAAPRTWQGEKVSPKKMANTINKNLFTVHRVRSYADVVRNDATTETKMADDIAFKETNDYQDWSDDFVSLWKDDSGATDHCCKDKHLFSSIEKCTIRLATAGEADIIQAEGVGTIDFIDEQGKMSVLDEVLYIPKLRKETICFLLPRLYLQTT